MASRIVHTTDGVAWLQAAELRPDHAVVTSLPDRSELRKARRASWEAWFVDTVALVCSTVAEDSVAIFFQTDVKSDGAWTDKSYLVQQGAARVGALCLWHKMVCRAAPGTVTHGRPGYAHLLCMSRKLRLDPRNASADVIVGLGEMPWARAMGSRACEVVARFLIAETQCRTVVDPFCGMGTMLAVANAYGLDAVGVERSPKRAEAARTLQLLAEHSGQRSQGALAGRHAEEEQQDGVPRDGHEQEHRLRAADHGEDEPNPHE